MQNSTRPRIVHSIRNRIHETKKFAAANIAAGIATPEEIETDLALFEDELKVMSAMSDTEFLSLKFRFASKPLPTILLFLCISTSLFSQHIDTAQLKRIDPYFATAFAHADCRQQFDTTYTIPSLPTMIRSNAVGNVFEFSEFVDFQVYWTPFNKKQSFQNTWLYMKGRCRGFSVSFPCPQPGIYSILFQHATKPCLMQIAVTPKDIHQAAHYVNLRFFQRCNPDIIFRHYRPAAAHLNLKKGDKTQIKIAWKPACNNCPLDKSDTGFSLIKTTETTNPETFNYFMPASGIWRFTYTSQAYPFIQDEYLLCTPESWHLETQVTKN